MRPVPEEIPPFRLYQHERGSFDRHVAVILLVSVIRQAAGYGLRRFVFLQTVEAAQS